MSQFDKMNISEALDIALDHYTGRRLEDAAHVCWQIVMHEPDCADAWMILGSIEFRTGNYHASAALMRRAIDLDQNCAAYHTNWSESLLAIGMVDEARRAAECAIKLNPATAEAYNNLALALDRRGDLDGAEAAIKLAIQHNPAMAEAYVNRLSILGKRGELSFGIEFGKKAMEIAPDVPEIPWNLSLLMLKAGRWAEGWPLYQYRWGCKKFPSPRWRFPEPRWNGAKFDGTLLIHAEQGHGDTMMLSRYMQLIRPSAKHIVWHVQDDLVEFARLVAPWAEVDKWGTASRFDRHCAMFDLPWIFNTTPDHVPPPTILELNRIGLLPDGYKIGYCWNGSTQHANNVNRSATADDFAELTKLDAQLVNLTYQKPPIEGTIDPMPMVRDWVTTAHIISELDMVITVDTAVAHLAATLGKPTICMLPSQGVDWRWMDKGESTPWYPSMRLVRKRKDQSWRECVGGVVASLREAQDEPMAAIENELAVAV